MADIEALDDVPCPITKVDFRGHNAQPLGQTMPLEELSPYKRNELLRGYRMADLLSRINSEASELLHGASEIHQEIFDGNIECGECGKNVRFSADLNELAFVAKFECTEIGGVQPYTVNLDIPSGKIVFANDFRDLVVVDASFDVNATIGRKQTTQAFATDGMVQISVGNTCPRVCQDGDRLTIGYGFDPLTDDDIDIGGSKVGSICTDLWWYSAMDYGVFLQRCVDENIEPDDYTHFTASVTPGVYGFTDLLVSDRDTPTVIFSTIQPTAEATSEIQRKPRSISGRIEDSQMLCSLTRTLERYPTLYSTKRGVLFSNLMVLGNGMRWIKGNLLDANRTEDCPFRKLVDGQPYIHAFRSDIPWFESQLGDWFYPLSLNITQSIGDVPLDVDPYWLAASLMVAQTVLQRGLHFDRHNHDVETQARYMSLILDYLCEIAAQRGLEDQLKEIFGQIILALDAD